MNTELDNFTIALLVIIIVFFAIVFLAGLITKIHNFRQELENLNREIARTDGAERKYWKREKRRLWLSLLPFCRRQKMRLMPDEKAGKRISINYLKKKINQFQLIFGLLGVDLVRRSWPMYKVRFGRSIRTTRISRCWLSDVSILMKI